MNPNPIGTPVKQALALDVQDVINTWKVNNPATSWWKRIKGQWVKAISFIVAAGDYFIRKVDDLLDEGPDKKATVLEALGEVYDSIVPGLLPFILKPFNKKIKSFVINVIASIMIDFFVGKYRVGNWMTDDDVIEVIE